MLAAEPGNVIGAALAGDIVADLARGSEVDAQQYPAPRWAV